MTRKGYNAEHIAKERLSEEFGKENIIKIAIAQQGADYLVLKGKEIYKLVEVKSTKGKRWYPIREKDLKQFINIVKFTKDKGIIAEWWIKTGGSTEFEILNSKDFYKKYFGGEIFWE